MPGQQQKVLLVDDNAGIRQFLRFVFESSGFSICAEAANGAEAIEQVSKCEPDLIVLDLAMPVMNGLQAAPALRQALPDVPIILFTVYGDSIQTTDAQAAGISSVLAKSDVNKLINHAEAHLKRNGFAARC